MFAAFTQQNLRVTEWASVGGTQQPARVAWGSYGIDMELGQLTLRHASGDRQAVRAFVTHKEQRASAAEHAVLEQLQRNPAISTVRVMALAHEAHTRIYGLTSANIEALLPGLDQTAALKNELARPCCPGASRDRAPAPPGPEPVAGNRLLRL